MASKDTKDRHHSGFRSLFHKSSHHQNSESPAPTTIEEKPLPPLPSASIPQRGLDSHAGSAGGKDNYSENASSEKPSGSRSAASPHSLEQQSKPEKGDDPITTEELASAKGNDDLWALAYKRLQANNKELTADLELYLDGGVNLDQVNSAYKDSLKERDSKQWAITIFGKDFKIRDQVDGLIKFALWSDNIIKPALSAQPIAQLAWTAVSITLPLLGNATAQHADMLSGYNAVCNVQRLYRFRLDTLRAKGALPTEVSTEIVTLYVNILEYQAKAICHLASSSIKRAWHGTWKSIDWSGMQTEVEKQNKVCDQFFHDLVGKEAQDLFREETEQMKRSVEIQEKIRSTLDEMLDVQKHTQRDEKVQNMLDRLDSSYSIGKNRCAKRVEGTGGWFSTHEDFQRFRDTENSSLLWLFGEPGSGKSALSRWVVDDELLRSNVLTTTVCYFFFHDDLQEQRDGNSALKAYIHQILTSPSTAYLASKMTDRTRPPTSLDELWSTLLDLVNDENAGEIVCVMDALDECEQSSRKELTNLIISYYNHINSSAENTPRLKFLVTSRPTLELENRVTADIQRSNFFSIIDTRNNAESIAHDIDIFIKHEIPRFYPEWTQAERDQLIEYLQSMENKNYLWLHLTFELMYQALPEFQSLSTAKEEMAKVPSTVADAYEKLIQKASSKVYARYILEIVLAAEHPLTVDELNVAFSILRSTKPHESLDSLRRDLYDPTQFSRNVREICGFFVEVYDSKVFFIHQTASQFLLATTNPESKIKDSEWQHSFDPKAFNSSLARCSLDFLSLWEEWRRRDDDNGPLGPDLEDDDVDKFQFNCDSQRDKALKAFLQYASRYWPVDLHQSSHEQQQSLLDKALEVCETFDIARDSASLWWFQVYVNSLYEVLRGRLGVLNPRLWTTFGVACVVGSAEVAEYCLKKSEASKDLMTASIADAGTPIEIAIKLDQENIAELLLKEGISIDKPDAEGLSLFAQAVNGGNVRITELLLDHGADPNEVWDEESIVGEPCHCLPFIAAAGSLDLLQRVLKECDGRLHSVWTTKALAGAIWSQESTIKRLDLLLKAGADVNGWTGEGLFEDYVLACAVEANDLPAFKHLAGKWKADIALQGPSALCAAASDGNLKMAKMLVERLRVDVNAELQGPIRSIQGAAASGGDPEILRLVSTSSTDWTACGAEALRRAAIEGHLEIVKILVEELDVDINAVEDGSNESAAAAAARQKHKDVLDFLQEQGAKLPKPKESIKKSLEQAISEGKADWVRALLEEARGDPNNDMNDLLSGSILESAASGGKSDIVQILIDSGVDLAVYGPPALVSTLRYNVGGFADVFSLDTLQVLLKNGVNPDAILRNGSMLQQAATYCNREAIELLVEHKASVAKFGPKAIWAAIQSPPQLEYTEEAIRKTVTLLMNRGARSGLVDSEKELEDAVRLAALEGLPDVLQELWSRKAPEDDSLWQGLSGALMMRATVRLAQERSGDVPRDKLYDLLWRGDRRYELTINMLIKEMETRGILKQDRFIGPDGLPRPFSEDTQLGRYWLWILADGKYFEEIYLAHLELSNEEPKAMIMLTYNKIIFIRMEELTAEWEVSFAQIQQISKEQNGLKIGLAGKGNERFIAIKDQESKMSLYRNIAVAINSYNRQVKEDAQAKKEEQERMEDLM